MALSTMVLAAAYAGGSGKTIKMDDVLDGKAKALGKLSAAAVAQSIQEAAATLKSGDALVLPFNYDMGAVTIASLPRDVQIIGGKNGTLNIDHKVSGAYFFGGDYELKASKGGVALDNTFIINKQGSITGSDVENTYWIGNIGTVNVDGTMKNCTGVWMRYNSEGQKASAGQPASFYFNLHGTGQNVKFLAMIEHNQGNRMPAVLVQDGDGIAFLGGATEGCNGSDPNWPFVYGLNNCKNVYLGHRRFFANHTPGKILADGGGSWYGNPTGTVQITGGSGNILDNVDDIANPKGYSLHSSDPNLQVWTAMWENPTQLDSVQKALLFTYADNCMPGINTWRDPRDIQDLQALTYKVGAQSVDLTANGAALPSGTYLPAPPDVPSCDIPKAPDLRYKQAASFGRDALAAGADPTGKRFSDAAFAKVLQAKNVLEIPAGTYKLERPLTVGASLTDGVGAFSGKKAWIIGAGKGATRLVYRGRGAAIVDAMPRPLAKSAAAAAAAAPEILMQGLTVDGGDYGFMITGTNQVQVSVDYTGYAIAGIGKTGASQPEQGRFIDCSMTGGQYGFYYEEYMDKYLIYKCQFKDHSKGGIYCINPANGQLSVYQCTFNNINGYGFAIIGGSEFYGQGPYTYRLGNCTFTECGNDTAAVINMGHGWLGVCNNNTVTNTKTAYAAFMGNFSIIDSLVTKGKWKNNVAAYLAHQGYERTSGLAGARVQNSTFDGEIRFLPRSWMKQTFPMTSDSSQRKNVPYLDTMYQNIPWAYTWMFYNVKSANYNEGYALYRAAQDQSVSKALDLCQFTANPGKCTEGTHIQPAAAQLVRGAAPARFYDLRGRRVDGAPGRLQAPQGLYLRKGGDGDLKKVIKL